MLKIKLTFLTFAISAFAQITCAQQVKLSKDVANAMNTVDSAEIKADIKYLADDKLLGRMPGTPGYRAAVDYVVDRLIGLKVLPAGEKGTWLQTVRLRKAIVHNTSLIAAGTVLPVRPADYVIYPNPSVPKIESVGKVVFAGYGISQPALGYDDYAGIDVKGKVILVMRGTPDKFSSSVKAHVANTTTILKTAAKHGAIGVIMASADSAVRTLTPVNRGVYSVMDDQGKVALSRSYYSDQIQFFISAKYGLLKSFLGDEVQSIAKQLKDGTPHSFVMENAGVAVSYTSGYQDIVSYNIVGKIEGSDPKLKNQYVVHSAHLDHLGIGVPVRGDSIYNGAHDNASGVAGLLGIAKVYAHMKVKPKRSVLIVMVTGEEMGDLGSGYFALHPTIPAKSMVADVNTDMPTIIAPLLSITALGAEHSSLAKQVDQAAGYLGISVEPDPEPAQARFTRSDQYSFVVNGIPALHVKYGNKTADGKNNLAEIVAPWRAKYYHKPQDDINGIFDFGSGKKYAQLNFLIGYLVAQDVKKPVWNTGDIFSTQQ
ncbi:peptidase M28 [Mucilaginibacter sp. PPCGB 2223]|uniref:M28 family peptidase n=1 Tax=Mucilaginibacter sp. PPCGB 2223 TaxID=1886027 RepID=UPI00082418AA|nr:M28 family peptidase [Mucilaginibacter sp. PPCGB 2223]OCX53092.1 peptidase M28 [Mucilaginibacter sp. PPCGB 2223]